ncbi:hypothetical protein JCM8547_006639 [Rhodosporidiobolus lusitaniae]
MQPGGGMLAHPSDQWTDYAYQPVPGPSHQAAGGGFDQRGGGGGMGTQLQQLQGGYQGQAQFGGYQGQSNGYYAQQGGAGIEAGTGTGGLLPHQGGGGGAMLVQQQHQRQASQNQGYGVVGQGGRGQPYDPNVGQQYTTAPPPLPPSQQQPQPSSSFSSFPAYPPRPAQPSSVPPPHAQQGPQQPAPSYGLSYVQSSYSSQQQPPPPPPSTVRPAPSANVQRFQTPPNPSPGPSHPYPPQQQNPLPSHVQQHQPYSPAPPPPQQRQPPLAPHPSHPPQNPLPPPTAEAVHAHLARIEEIKAVQHDIRSMESILQRGVYPEGGPRAGHPLTGEQQAQVDRQVRDLKNRELAVINDCEAFIRSNGEQANVQFYVKRFQASQQQHQQQQQQQQQQQAHAAQQHQQNTAMYPAQAAQVQQRPPSVLAYNALQGGQPQPQQPYGGGAPVYQQQQQEYVGRPLQQPQQAPPQVQQFHPQQPLPGGRYTPQAQQQQQQQHPQLHRQPPSSALVDGVPGLPPQQGQQYGGAPLPQPVPPVQQQHPQFHPSHPLQSAFPPPSQSPHPTPTRPPSAAPLLPQPPPSHTLPPQGSSLPPQPPPPGHYSFSPDLPPGLRVSLAAAQRESAQRALLASRAKIARDNPIVRPAKDGEMPYMTMGGLKTKEEWERMEKERGEKEKRRREEEGRRVGEEKMRRRAEEMERASGGRRRQPTMVLAEQAAAGGGKVMGLGELVAAIQPEAFWEQLKLVMSKRGQSVAPQGYFVESKAVDLYQLFRAVVGTGGGYIKVDTLASWPSIASQLSLPSTPPSPVPALIKELYYRILVPFEDSWALNVLKQREKEQTMQDALKHLEAKGHGGGANGTAPQQPGQFAPPVPAPPPSPHLRNALPGGSAAGYGSSPHASSPGFVQQSYVPGSGSSPSAFTIPTPAPSIPSSALAPSPSPAFALPPSAPISSTTPSALGANFPLTSAPSPAPFTGTPSIYNVPLPPVAPPGSSVPSPGTGTGTSSMFASAFPSTPMSELTFPSGTAQAGFTLGGGGGAGMYHASPQQQQATTLVGSPEKSADDLLAEARALRAEGGAPASASTPSSGVTPQTSSTPREQPALLPAPASPAAAAAAAGQVAPLSVGGVPSVMLSRTNSLIGRIEQELGGGGLCSSPGQLSVTLPLPTRPEGLSRTASGSSGSRKRDREMSREMDLGAMLALDEAGEGGGGAGGTGRGDEEDEGRKREGSNPFHNSPLSQRGGGGGLSAKTTPPAAGTKEEQTPDLLPSNALRPDTSSTIATGSPSPHSVTSHLPPSSSSQPPQPATSVSTPSATAPVTPGAMQNALSTPAGQLASSFGGSLALSTPPIPLYQGLDDLTVGGGGRRESDPFGPLGDLRFSPSLDFGGGGGAGDGTSGLRGAAGAFDSTTAEWSANDFLLSLDGAGELASTGSKPLGSSTSAVALDGVGTEWGTGELLEFNFETGTFGSFGGEAS